MWIVVALVFAVVALFGLFAALRPQMAVRYLLADWQRERLLGQHGAVSWTGWVIFACSTFVVVVMLIADIW